MAIGRLGRGCSGAHEFRDTAVPRARYDRLVHAPVPDDRFSPEARRLTLVLFAEGLLDRVR